jgi:hypothetical protein
MSASTENSTQHDKPENTDASHETNRVPGKTPPSSGRQGSYPLGTLGASFAKQRQISDLEAEKLLFDGCIRAGLRFQARLLKPFIPRAFDYCALTIRDVGLSRSVDDVIEALEYWEERRPAALQGWFSKRVRLKKSRIIDFAAQYLEC